MAFELSIRTLTASGTYPEWVNMRHRARGMHCSVGAKCRDAHRYLVLRCFDISACNSLNASGNILLRRFV